MSLVVGWWPTALEIGAGAYVALLGANVYGLGLVTVAYVLPRTLARAGDEHPVSGRPVPVGDRRRG